MMKRNGKRRVLSLLLCAAMLLSLVPVLTVAGDPAEAKTSLPGIEAMKAGATLNILEIAPSADQGSIGYYIAGQEPCRNWLSVASGKSGADRLSYVNGLFNGLASAGLLSSDDTKPLKAVYSSGGSGSTYYDEKYPWDSPTGYTKMTLASPDSVSVTGSYKEKANGGYNLVSGFTLVANGSGTYNQKIAYYSTEPAGAEQYYYNPIFTKIEDTEIDSLQSGTPVYTNPGTGSTPDYDKYVYVGTVGPSFILHYDPKTTYYKVTDPGTPSQTQETAGTGTRHYYVGVIDSYVQAAGGHFTPQSPVLQYVGDNSGAYSFTAGANGASVTIKTSAVWYKGGFTNNDWFLRHVFDYDEAELAAAKEAVKFNVTTETPDAVTTAQVDSAGLIVLARGLKIDSGTVSTTGYTTETFQSGVDTAILNAVKKDTGTDTDTDYGKPVIVDYQLYVANSTGATPSALATTLLGTDYAMNGKSFTGSPTSWVGGSIYVFDSNTQKLATGAFATAFAAELYNTSSAPFGEVWDDIGYENFLRMNKGQSGSALLSEAVSMAACVRYIINYNQKRSIIAEKDKISVLDVEPSYTDSGLTAATVATWLNMDVNKISVVTMSTSELIGKIDDLSEIYDLIYIGANSDCNTNSFVNDAASGMRYKYANIGAKHNGRVDALGIIDQDYDTNTFTVNKKDYHKLKSAGENTPSRYSGNDLTQTKYDELKNYVDFGYPIVIDDGLIISTAGKPAVDAIEYTVNISSSAASSVGGYPTLTATPVAVTYGASLPSGATYNWYNNTNPNKSIGTSATYTPTADGTYYCTVSYTDVAKAAASRQIKIEAKTADTLTVTANNDAQTGYANYYNYYYYYKATTTANGNTITVTPSIDTYYGSGDGRPGYSNNAFSSAKEYQYQWYKNGFVTGATSNTYTISSAGTYYCYVTIPKGKNLYYNNSYFNANSCYSAHSQTFTASKKTTTTYTASDPTGTATKATIPGSDKVDYVISTGAVDNSSIMYDFLTYAVNRVNNGVVQNVMQESNLATSTNKPAVPLNTTLKRYVNLTKPSIVFDTTITANDQPGGKPPVYVQGNASGDLAPGGTLKYTFTIANQTDPDVSKTRYNCKLYIDSNGDGRYTDDEYISDITIADESGAAVKSGELKAGKKYTVSRALTADQIGILPWKLTIVSTKDAGVHASQQNYAHVTVSSKKAINVLQINTSRRKNVNKQTYGYANGPDGGLILDNTGTWTDVSLGAYYSQLGDGDYSSTNNNSNTNKIITSRHSFLDAINGATDFSIHIQTVTVNEVNNLDADKTKVLTNKLLQATPSYDNLDSFLDSYDMILIGVDECYNELHAGPATALANFIKSGKPLLYTHDTSSMPNVPEVYMNNKPDSGCGISNQWYFGYAFNSILRNAIGLDRYGVTDNTYGHTSMAGQYTKSGPVASGYSDFTDFSGLVNAGYSVAYKPGSEKADTVLETQGLTNYMYDTYMTTTVSQVNQGQITTYPYNINTTGFVNGDKDKNRMTVANTHQQYYQVNMNQNGDKANDIVVWYCLKNGAYEYNDVENAYYVYSKGSATYTGFGHTITNIGPPEAKLFVNTMIAAYRVAKAPPTTGFTTDDKTTVTTDYVVPADNGTTLANGDQKVWFKLTDNNIGAGKTIQVTFTANDNAISSYISPATPFIPVYGTDDYSVTTLVSGSYYVKLSDLKNYLGDSISDIKMTVKTTFTNDTTGVTSSPAPLNVHKFDLFDLS